MEKLRFTLIIILLSTMASCNDPIIVDNNIDAKLKELYRSDGDLQFHNLPGPIVIKKVSPMASVGDTIQIANKYYLVLQVSHPQLRHYQVEMVSEDSLGLYDGERLVGSISTNWEHGLDSLILKDNE